MATRARLDLVSLAVVDFAGQTNPIKATAADYERLFLAAM